MSPRNIAPLIVLLLGSTAQAGSELERLHGTWTSPDGQARQQFEPDFDGSWLNTRMWFRDGDGWMLVATGGI